MSAKGRGRGKKAANVEVTQENIIEKAQDDAPTLTEKKGSKRKQAAENGSSETNLAPLKRVRGRGKEQESAPVEEKPVPTKKESAKPKRGGKKTAPEKEEVIEEPKLAAPAKRGGRGKKVIPVESEPTDSEPEAQAESKDEIEPKKAAKKEKRGAKKEKAEEYVEEAQPSNSDENDEKKEEIAAEEHKPEKSQPAKKGRGKKPAKEEERQPVKTAGAKKMVTVERRKRVGEVRKEEVENGNVEAEDEVALPAKKAARGGRKRQMEPAKDQESAENGSPEGEGEVITAPKKAKAAPKKTAKINETTTNYSDADFNLDKPFNYKIASWNVAGLRSWVKKGGLEFIEYEKPDIICLQEIKCTVDQLPDEARIPGYHPYWLCKAGGYAGVAIYSKIMPINVEYGLGDPEQDADGRIITAEFEKFFLISVYVPNAGRKLVTLPKRMRWDQSFQNYVNKLHQRKPVIIAGDMNVSHKEIDLANPKANRRNAGFTDEEREGMTKLLSAGFVDTFRHLYPARAGAYTFWTYLGNARSRNVGWRLDYFIVSEKLLPKVVENALRSKVLGSDHCPITLFLNL